VSPLAGASVKLRTMRVAKKILFGAVVTFIAIQFLRPVKNVSAGRGANDATVRYPTPPEVRALLAVACYDCHSNNTRYPWYDEIQPVGWWLAKHVKDGKYAFNFSELGAYSTKTAMRRLATCVDEVSDRTMPLSSYRIIHKDARLTDAQIKLLTDWFEETSDLVKERGTPASSAPGPASTSR